MPALRCVKRKLMYSSYCFLSWSWVLNMVKSNPNPPPLGMGETGATPLWHRAQTRLAIHALLLRSAHTRGHAAGTCRGDKSHRVNARFSWKILLRGRNFVPATCPLNSNQFELRDMSRRQNNVWTQGRLVWTVHATCPRDTSENKPIRKRNHNKSLRQDPPCEHFKKPIPATCPFVWTAHEILPRDMSLQHVPSCEPTFTAIYGHKGFVWEDRWAVND